MGNYTSPPARRWAYDAEGFTVVRYRSDDGSPTALSGANVNDLNDENDDTVTLNPSGGVVPRAILVDTGAWNGATGYVGGDGVSHGGVTYVCIVSHTNQEPPNAVYWTVSVYVYLAFIPAEVRQLAAVALFFTLPSTVTFRVDIQYSDDTTDGQDGTWASLVPTGTTVTPAITVQYGPQTVNPAYREAIVPLAWDAGTAYIIGDWVTHGNVTYVAILGGTNHEPPNGTYWTTITTHTAYRFQIGPTPTTIAQSGIECALAHLFGLEAGPADRLAFWDPVADVELAADLDLGDVPRVGESTLTFRIKNLSALTASAITLTSEPGVSDGNSSSWTLLSTDDVTYGQNISPADLASGAISPVLYVKSAPASDDDLQVHVCRISGVATFS